MTEHSNTPASLITTLTLAQLATMSNDDIIHFLGSNCVVAVYEDEIVGISDTIAEPVEIVPPECWLYRAVASDKPGAGSFVGAPNAMALAILAALPVKPHFGKVWRFGAPQGQVVNQDGQSMRLQSTGSSELYNDNMDSMMVVCVENPKNVGTTVILVQSNIDA